MGVGDAVLLALVLAGLDHERVQVLEVRDQIRVPGLDEAARREVLDPADVGAEDVWLGPGVDFRERVGLVRHVAELRLVLRVRLHVCGEHGLATVVSISRPVEHLERAQLRAEPGERCLRCVEAGPEYRRSSGSNREPQELVAAQSLLDLLVVVHYLSSSSP